MPKNIRVPFLSVCLPSSLTRGFLPNLFDLLVARKLWWSFIFLQIRLTLSFVIPDLLASLVAARVGRAFTSSFRSSYIAFVIWIWIGHHLLIPFVTVVLQGFMKQSKDPFEVAFEELDESLADSPDTHDEIVAQTLSSKPNINS
ncbi:unnamed protein product [Lactuca saligna]|uniref:Uncharacterized protein n=1 Tax=Lactuca saligna TaxID=75948 RepID=A0AA35VF07_LACSI|nr:unnamed protein product [Lactuca saligna]